MPQHYTLVKKFCFNLFCYYFLPVAVSVFQSVLKEAERNLSVSGHLNTKPGLLQPKEAYGGIIRLTTLYNAIRTNNQ